MSDLLPVVFAVTLMILTIVLGVVGIQLILVLIELRRTLKRINTTLDQAEAKLAQVVSPLKNLGGMAAGIKSGMKIFEAFVAWLNRDKTDKTKKD